MYTYFLIAIFQNAVGERIVKIFGSIRVDGKSQDVAHVPSTFNFGWINLNGYGLRLLNHLIGKIQLESTVDENGFHLDITAASFTEYRSDFTNGMGLFSLGPIRNLDDYFFTIFSTFVVVFFYQNIHLSWTIRRDQSIFRIFPISTHKVYSGALHYFQHFTFWFAPPPGQPGFDFDQISIECAIHVSGGHMDVLFFAFNNDLSRA